MQEDKSGIRSFIVLMDKNKDTQWIEDGKFVDNPIPKPSYYSKTTALFSELTGIPFVTQVNGTAISDGTTHYVVTGYLFATDPSSKAVTRTVTVRS